MIEEELATQEIISGFKSQIDHFAKLVDTLTKERDGYREKWLASLTKTSPIIDDMGGD